jgi:hypothetical protein
VKRVGIVGVGGTRTGNMLGRMLDVAEMDYVGFDVFTG